MDIPGYAIVTGAASGIGRACVRAFARDGAAGVALLDTNASALDMVKSECEELAKTAGTKFFKTLAYTADVRDENEIERIVSDAAQNFGRLDYAVSCAGVGFKHEGGAAFAQTSDWQRVLDINLNGTFFILRAAAKIMLKQEPILSKIDGRPLQRGSIVNIASILGVVGTTMSTAYTASKHAVIGLTRTASEDYAKDGLRINAVCPGYVDTPLTQKFAAVLKERSERWTPMKRPGQPEEIANAVIFLCGGRASYITGSAMLVDGGYTEH